MFNYSDFFFQSGTMLANLFSECFFFFFLHDSKHFQAFFFFYIRVLISLE